jgi:hypothetical protein
MKDLQKWRAKTTSQYGVVGNVAQLIYLLLNYITLRFILRKLQGTNCKKSRIWKEVKMGHSKTVTSTWTGRRKESPELLLTQLSLEMSTTHIKSLNNHGHTNSLLAKSRFALTIYELYAVYLVSNNVIRCCVADCRWLEELVTDCVNGRPNIQVDT